MMKLKRTNNPSTETKNSKILQDADLVQESQPAVEQIRSKLLPGSVANSFSTNLGDVGLAGIGEGNLMYESNSQIGQGFGNANNYLDISNLNSMVNYASVVEHVNAENLDAYANSHAKSLEQVSGQRYHLNNIATAGYTGAGVKSLGEHSKSSRTIATQQQYAVLEQSDISKIIDQNMSKGLVAKKQLDLKKEYIKHKSTVKLVAFILAIVTILALVLASGIVVNHYIETSKATVGMALDQLQQLNLTAENATRALLNI